MIYAFIVRRCSDLPAAACCRAMKVSTSGFYGWRACPVGERDWADAQLTNTIVDIHRASRRSYGSPRIHADLRLGQGVRCSRKRVERLMRQARIHGVHRRKRRGCTRRDPAAEPAEDLVNRCFDPAAPDRLWLMDVTEHPTGEGKVYLAVVLDAFSRRVVGWSIAEHMRAELVVDAVQMAIWRRRPPPGQTVAHSDHGSQGGFRWSSQRLVVGGVDGDDARAAAGRAAVSGGRFRRRGGRRWRGGGTGCGSGRRSPGVPARRTRRSRSGCHPRLGHGGSVTLAA